MLVVAGAWCWGACWWAWALACRLLLCRRTWARWRPPRRAAPSWSCMRCMMLEICGTLLTSWDLAFSEAAVLQSAAHKQARDRWRCTGMHYVSAQVLLCAGMLTAALVDWGLSSLPGAWRWMVAMPLAPALLMSGGQLASAHIRRGGQLDSSAC